METLRGQQEQAPAVENSQRNLLGGGLSRSMSKKGFGLSSEHGLRSQALLQNYIDQNLSGTAQGNQVAPSRPPIESDHLGYNSQQSRGSKKQMQQVAQLLGASESRASLRPGGGDHVIDNDALGAVVGGQSIEHLKNRELLKAEHPATLIRSRTAQESVSNRLRDQNN